AGAAGTSPAKLAEAPVPEKSPQADLHPPTIPQLVREPAATTHPDNNALFPWVEQPGDRLATRPGVPASTPSPAVGPSPAAAPASQPQYPVTAAGAPTSPAYPVTSAPNSNFAAPADQHTANAANTSPYLPAASAVQPP